MRGVMQHMNKEKFSVWMPWNHRKKLPGIHWPGIYALATSNVSLEGRSFDYIKNIVYFGMTNSVAGLKGRLQQFDNTINGKSGHGGADRFCNDYPTPQELTPILFVAVMPIECNVSSNTAEDLLLMGRVAMAEYECFAQYVKLHNELPKYNNKKTAPKRPKIIGHNILRPQGS